MYCKLDYATFEMDVVESYEVKENEIIKQGDIIKKNWLVCSAEPLTDSFEFREHFNVGEYIRLFYLPSVKFFTTDFKLFNKNLVLISKNYGEYTYYNKNYDKFKKPTIEEINEVRQELK